MVNNKHFGMSAQTQTTSNITFPKVLFNEKYAIHLNKRLE